MSSAVDPPAPSASALAAVLSEPWVGDLLPPNVTGLCFNESRNNVPAGGEPERQLYLWLTRRGNNAANMHLSLPSYCDTSFSAFSLLNLRLRDLDFLSQESIFLLLSPIFFLLTETSKKKKQSFGRGEWSGIGGLHCAVLWPRIGSGGFNSLISHFQTAAERESRL